MVKLTCARRVPTVQAVSQMLTASCIYPSIVHHTAAASLRTSFMSESVNRTKLSLLTVAALDPAGSGLLRSVCK